MTIGDSLQKSSKGKEILKSDMMFRLLRKGI